MPSVLFVSTILFFYSSSTVAYDIAVYGATPGGISAAITAARVSSSLKIALIEPTADIGGMSTGGGLGLRDLGLDETSELLISFSAFFLYLRILVVGSVAYDWVKNNMKYYPKATNLVYQPDVKIGYQSFHDLISNYSNIELVTGTGPLVGESLQMNGTRIVQVMTADDRRIWKASVWIDGSYEGDLVRYSKASYTCDRESCDQYGES